MFSPQIKHFDSIIVYIYDVEHFKTRRNFFLSFWTTNCLFWYITSK